MDITMPQLGESVSEGTILRWFKSVGEPVATNEVLFEVATDKVDAEVPSPVAGVVTEIRVPEGATIPVGAVLAVVDGATTPVRDPASVSPPLAPARAVAAEAEGNPPAPTPLADTQPRPTGALVPPASPLVRRILREAGVALEAVAGTGRLGRITRGDAERAAASRQPLTATSARPKPDSPAPSAFLPQPNGAPVPSPATSQGPSQAATPTAAAPDTVTPMSRIRQRTAAHMVRSRATSPHALVATEVRYDNVEYVRRAQRETFRAEEGTSLTYLPFIARATIDALRRFPAVNASVTDGPTGKLAGDGLLLHGDINLAFAVDLGFDGLVAPVIHHADDYRLRALARRVGDAARRGRSGDLGPDDLVGGTFTISNSGSYGTHLVIPIINQPQVAILSTDAVRRQPVVVRTDEGDEAIGIGSVGLLALSWDHRAFDGAYASAFLDEVRTILEARDWEAELR